jgi:hypothetical protein
MLSPTTEIPRCSKRIDALKEAVQGAKPSVCTERAMIWTRYSVRESKAVLYRSRRSDGGPESNRSDLSGELIVAHSPR